jgi:hypothetical protein
VSGELGIFEELKAAVEAQTGEIRALREEVAALHERVEPTRDVYTVKDLWLLEGGSKLCTFASYQKNRHLPPPDGYVHRMRAWKRETARHFLSSFDVQVARRGRPASPASDQGEERPA